MEEAGGEGLEHGEYGTETDAKGGEDGDTEAGEDGVDAGVDVEVAPCTDPDRDAASPLGEGGVEADWLGLLPSPACSSTSGVWSTRVAYASLRSSLHQGPARGGCASLRSSLCPGSACGRGSIEASCSSAASPPGCCYPVGSVASYSCPNGGVTNGCCPDGGVTNGCCPEAIVTDAEGGGVLGCTPSV
jgi:hypothetical protein